MPIFQDENGLAIKFFIQKDIPQEIQAEVCETIAALGGRVETKVPRAGYILVQPGTAEEERLRICWTTNERPDRYFVPYTYIEACKVAGMLLKQIFIHDGQPIRMHIDSSIANVNVRAALSARIMHSGGDPTASAQSARVILADPNTEVFQHLVKTYQAEPEKFVESYLWVKKCIEKGAVIYTPVVYKNPGGRRPGEERTQFTEQDEENLCNWIAAKIPYKETGGRTGNRLYQQLCEMVGDPEYAWVIRHTWQSWRERYKKNATRLDIRIGQIVEQKKPAHGEKGQYGYVRKPEEKPKRSRKKVKGNGPLEDEAGPSNFALPMSLHPPPSMIVSHPHPPPPGYPTVLYPPPPSGSLPPYRPIPPTQPSVNGVMQNRPSGSNSSAPAQELEDDESEWQIRIGNAPPPAWAKRKGESEEAEPSNKRKRTSEEQSDRGTPAQFMDQVVHEIARQFRFTIGEVQEYYDRYRDVDRTRRRFRKMREVLAALKDDEDVGEGARSIRGGLSHSEQLDRIEHEQEHSGISETQEVESQL
ncbi:hypothetical protein C8Q75DRAFT_848771 [Abortiporus biennis]|nr:hypothetical protein C8Q75DRAFT_848771 [Abortiporus biennis]